MLEKSGERQVRRCSRSPRAVKAGVIVVVKADGTQLEASADPGANVPLTLTVPGSSSAPVTMAIQRYVM